MALARLAGHQEFFVAWLSGCPGHGMAMARPGKLTLNFPPATGTQEEIEDPSHHEQDQSPSHAKDKWSQFHFKFSDATPAVIDR